VKNILILFQKYCNICVCFDVHLRANNEKVIKSSGKAHLKIKEANLYETIC
jgi:hypothetical protein